MSEDKDKKTEEPTSKRLREARKKGQVAKSKEVVTTASLFFISVYFFFAWEDHVVILKDFITLPERYFGVDFDLAYSSLFLTLLIIAFESLILPIILVALVAGVLFHIFQFGFLLAFDPVMPKMEKINPVSGFSKIFSTKSLLENILALFKIIFISLIVTYVIYSAIHDFPTSAIECSVTCFLAFAQKTILKLMSLLIPFFILLSILDYILQKHEFIKNQKMTKEEVKKDHKSSEGDPFIKSMRKSIHTQAMNDDFMDRMKQTRMIITDYNHAITIAYDRDRMLYPVILNIGTGVLLTKMLSVARSERIPVINDAPLTNVLLNDGEIDAYVPKSTLDKMAVIIRNLQD